LVHFANSLFARAATAFRATLLLGCVDSFQDRQIARHPMKFWMLSVILPTSQGQSPRQPQKQIATPQI
ncbi:MAG: hypothetical protein WBV78_15145, partial [Roseobacter sp.]